MLKSVLSYVVNSIPYMLCVVPAFLIVRGILYLCIHNKRKFNILHEIVLLLFVMFCVGVASQTIIPKIEFGTAGVGIVYENLFGEINLIPGKVFYDIYRECAVNHYYLYFVINFVGNICLFLPIGFGLALLWEDMSSKKVTIAGLISSLFIELCQLPQARGTDIDDVWLNMLGAICGYFIYRGFSKIPFLYHCFTKIKA